MTVPEAKNEKHTPVPKWTGKIIDLVELVFSIQEAHSVNHGELATKHLVAQLAKFFHIEVKDCFGCYMDMRGRADSRTLYLDKLTMLLENKMDRDDEKDKRRKK